MSGGVLLSHTPAGAVPSALKGLASGFGMGPGVSPSLWPPGNLELSCPCRDSRLGVGTCLVDAKQWCGDGGKWGSSPRPISTGQLRILRCVHFRPIDPMIGGGPYPLEEVGDLILERASRLDAFSGYLFRT